MRTVLLMKQKGVFNELDVMSDVEKLEFEFEWIHAEIERLEEEASIVGLKLAELKKEQCLASSASLISKEAKEKGLCWPCYVDEVGN